MIGLLTRRNRELVAQLAWSPALLAFDFDGTLAPIVAARDDAAMRPTTLASFERVCELYPVAVISGRARADVRARLGRARPGYVIGNHGLEPGGDLRAFEAEIREVRPLLASALGALQGVDLEDKRYSLAIHFRQSRQKLEARAAIERAVTSLPRPMRLVPGKQVLNVVPLSAPDKGDALLALRAREGATTALYVGDDVTDEDVFRIDQPGRLLGVRIGRARGSLARYFLRDQGEIDTLLAWLCEFREDRPDGRARR